MDTEDTSIALAEYAVYSAANSMLSDITIISDSLTNINLSDPAIQNQREALYLLIEHIEKTANATKQCFKILCEVKNVPLSKMLDI